MSQRPGLLPEASPRLREQTMTLLAPTLAASRYLDKTEQWSLLPPRIRTDAVDLIQKGSECRGEQEWGQGEGQLMEAGQPGVVRAGREMQSPVEKGLPFPPVWCDPPSHFLSKATCGSRIPRKEMVPMGAWLRPGQ